MSKHLEHVVDVDVLLSALRTAMHSKDEHARAMELVIAQDGIDDLITVEAAERIRDDHKNEAGNIREMIDAIDQWRDEEYE